MQQCEYTLCLVYENGEWWTAPHESAVKIGDSLSFPNHEYPDNLVICKFDIPAIERKKVLKMLDEQNVNAFSLFGSEKSLMETLSLRHFLLKD